MVHQHFMLIPVMTVAENIVLGNEPMRDGHPARRARCGRAVCGSSSKQFGLRRRPGRRWIDRHHRRPAAARRDHEGALPRRGDPHPRRADRRPDAAGGDASSSRSSRSLQARRELDHLHQPQAERGARDRRPHHRAPARQEDRDRSARGRDGGVARARDGRARGAAPRRQAARAAGRRAARGRGPARPRRPRHRQGARRLVRRARGRDRRHRGRRRQRADRS